MVQCQNCGKLNSDGSHFCRFCGNKFLTPQPAVYDNRPPRPYAWKTDEYQTQSDSRRINQPAPQAGALQQAYGAPAYGQSAIAYQGQRSLVGNYRCPHCGTSFLPVMERRISTAGWITFGLLLVFTVILFWIGFLLKEDVAICPVCRGRVN